MTILNAPQSAVRPDSNTSLDVSVSETENDQTWDDFLLTSPAGSISQTSLWAKVKASEGWRPLRLILRRGAQIVAGVQVLWKMKYGIRCGYVVRGPVPESNTIEAATEMVSQLVRLTSQRRFTLLLVQPPDGGSMIPQVMNAKPFLPNHLYSVISANLVVDLCQGWDAVEKCFRRTTRQQVRQAYKSGVTIREGGREELPTFHALMTNTCQRLRTTPNPRTVATLLALWQAAEPRKNIRLTLAEYGGQTIAGLLSLAFGRTLTFWKKGSDETGRSLHADQALFHEGIAWACQNGFAHCDFASMSPDTAHALIRGEPLPEKAHQTRDFLHLGYGGTPILLPESRILLPHAFLQIGYLALSRFRQGRALLRCIGGTA